MSKFPRIRAWETRPVQGGWTVTVEINGHPFTLTGSPTTIRDAYVTIHRKNGIEMTNAKAEAFLDEVYCEREPQRCLVPSLRNMAKSALQAARGEIAARMGGAAPVDAEEINRRLAICKGCQFFRNNRCAKCGCFLQLKARTRSGTCPAGKW